jgi:hypothetical protein
VAPQGVVDLVVAMAWLPADRAAVPQSAVVMALAALA